MLTAVALCIAAALRLRRDLRWVALAYVAFALLMGSEVWRKWDLGTSRLLLPLFALILVARPSVGSEQIEAQVAARSITTVSP